MAENDKPGAAPASAASTAGQADASAGEAGAKAAPTVPLTVRAQYVRDQSFENPGAPGTLMPGQAAPQVQLNVNVRAEIIQDRDYEVTLTISASAQAEAKPVFVAELAYAGVFTVGEIAEEHVQPLLLIEGPRLLFPFARAIVASMTRDGGFPPMMMHPIDFAALYRQQAAAQQAKDAATLTGAAGVKDGDGGNGATGGDGAKGGNGAGKD